MLFKNVRAINTIITMENCNYINLYDFLSNKKILHSKTLNNFNDGLIFL